MPHTMTDGNGAELQERSERVSGDPGDAEDAGNFTPRQLWRSVPCVGYRAAETILRGHLPTVWRADAGNAERRRKRLLAHV